MGFESYWLNERSDVSGMDFANCLFITEGQHDGNIPLRDDCKYVLHNCCSPKWQDIKPENKLMLQVYTHDVIKHGAEKIGRGVWLLKEGRGLFQPWATDLLPHEFNFDDVNTPRSRDIHWVGTISEGQFGNTNEINQFKNAAKEAGINFVHHPPGSTSFEDNRRLIMQSYLAPAIHGTWQTNVGYIACRVFKNISYGQLGVTNSQAAFDLLDGMPIYSSDPYKLFHDARLRMENKEEIKALMRHVQEHHTYINRVNSILSVI